MKDVFKNHKVGDKVWNLQTKKWETIEKIIKDSNYPLASRIIRDTIDAKLIKPYSEGSSSKRDASYVPFWA